MFEMCIRFSICVFLPFYALNNIWRFLFKKLYEFLTSLSCGLALSQERIQGDFLPSFLPHSSFGATLVATDLFCCHSCLRCQDNEGEEWLAV